MDGTIIQQGRFTADGTTQRLAIRSDVDWMHVYNETAIIAGGAGNGVKFYWQRGMTAGRGMIYTKLAADESITLAQLAAGTGFTLVNEGSDAIVSAAVATTNASNVVRPIILTADTTGLADGDVVRLTNQATDLQLNGYDFTIDTVVANTSFRIAGALANVGGAGGAQAGFYRRINVDPLYYPRHRFIANITQAASAVITLTIPSGYAVGQEVRILVPDDRVANASVYGMTEIDNLTGTITAVDNTVATQTITVDIDSTAFTAFSFPTAAQAAATLHKAMVVPIGMDTAQAITSAVDLLSDATDNQSIIGMQLAGGDDAPGGGNNDVMYWQAGKSFSVTNL